MEGRFPRMLLNRVSARLPDIRSVVPVFAVVSLVLYGWTFISAFWKLNSWRMNLTVWDITSLVSLLMIKSFLETLLIVAVILLLSLLLPAAIWRDKFIVRGSLTALCILLSMILHIRFYGRLQATGIFHDIVQSVSQWWILALIVSAVLVVFLPRFRPAERALHELADRAVVFLYIFLPVTVIGLLVLVIRFLVSA